MTSPGIIFLYQQSGLSATHLERQCHEVLGARKYIQVSSVVCGRTRGARNTHLRQNNVLTLNCAPDTGADYLFSPARLHFFRESEA